MFCRCQDNAVGTAKYPLCEFNSCSHAEQEFAATVLLHFPAASVVDAITSKMHIVRMRCPEKSIDLQSSI